MCTGNEGNRRDPMLMGGTVAGLGGSSTIEGVAAGGGVQVEGRCSDKVIFEAGFVANVAWRGEGGGPCMRLLGTSDRMSKRSESSEEPIGSTELGVLGSRHKEESARPGRIGVLDLRSTVTLAPDARGGGERRFCLDSSSLRLCGFNCPETAAELHKEKTEFTVLRLGMM